MTTGSWGVTFEDWVRARSLASLGTNAGSDPLPFQSWRRFKEAFAPELVARAVRRSAVPVTRCVDPFGGSGTTALACQFLGVHPTSIEVNPFLADLMAAKLSCYDIDALSHDLGRVLRWSAHMRPSPSFLAGAPQTLIEPGRDGRWVFDAAVASRIGALLAAISRLHDQKHRRLFRVLVGGSLVDLSNVTISGKGRRYRKPWMKRKVSPADVDAAFRRATATAIEDIRRYSRRAEQGYTLLLGDARELTCELGNFELAVFSPPYPNSFDYTDVYNLELWVLGYLRTPEDNRALRLSTLSSHVQILRNYATPPSASPTMRATLKRLDARTDQLWSRWIPSMLGAYFADVEVILRGLAQGLHPKGTVWMVVGDSRYAGVQVPTAEIVSEIASDLGYDVVERQPFRSMRSSPQQGGDPSLSETLLVLGPRPASAIHDSGIRLMSRRGTKSAA